MDDMNAFERIVAAEVQVEAGPSRPTDVAAVIRTAATQSPRWRFGSMFSATKFVAAGAIVALFGGFLLAGLLTQPSDDRLPVGASASAATRAESTYAATAEPEPLLEAVEITTRADILPGVDLVTEELGPGLFRVLGDGERQTSRNLRDIAVTADGDVWLMRANGTVFRLGAPGTAFQERDQAFHRRNDGTLWVATWDTAVAERARKLEGADWVRQRDPFCVGWRYHLAADGTCWAAATYKIGHRFDESGRRLEMNQPDGFLIGQFMAVAPDGAVWATVVDLGGGVTGVASYDGSTWTTFDNAPLGGGRPAGLGLAPDGVIWTMWADTPGSSRSHPLLAASWDGTSWTDHGRVRGSSLRRGLALPAVDAIDFVPDGTPWFGGAVELVSGTLQPIEVLAPIGDGTAVVEVLANGPDGSIWMVVDAMGDQHELRGGLYVITPEAVAATE